MLHLFDIRINDQGAGRHDGAGQFRHRGPAPEAACCEEAYGQRSQNVAPDRMAGTAVSRSHDFTSPSDASFTDRKCGLVRSRTFWSTSSFGPNVCTWPFAIASSRSTPKRAEGRCAITITMAPRLRAPRVASVSAWPRSATRLGVG